MRNSVWFPTNIPRGNTSHMCGRCPLTTPPDELAEAFDAPNPPKLAPRYNVAPSQLIAVVGLKSEGKPRGIAHPC